MPYFSVVITVFNKENYIQETIKSVLNQSFVDFEVIIVNDGSTDSSESKILEIQDKRIQYFYKNNEGAGSARNFGIEKSNCDYICFLDGDDIWKENHLEVLYKLINKFPNAGLYASRYHLIFKNNHIYTPIFDGIVDNYEGVISDYFLSSMNYPVATSSSIAVPRKVFESIGNFKTYISSGQDTDMWIRITVLLPIVISNQVTASYLHFIDDSLSKTNILTKKIKPFEEYKNWEDKNISLKKYLDKYRKEYALKYKMAGENNKAKELYNQTAKENIDNTFWVLFHLPTKVLKLLLNFKQYLRSLGIDFNVYK
jgi:glycosyltransferase involved in cell wall biosynthesis